MKLIEAEVGSVCEVTALEADTVLKRRLLSFGISKGVRLKVQEHALAKAVVAVKVNKALVAIRSSEAACIKVRV